MNDTLKATGSFHLKVYKNDVLIDEIKQNNLVVTLGKQNIARLLGGHVQGKKVEKIAVGTSATDTNVADAAITGMFSKPVDSVTFPEDNSVMFHFDIDNGEANGMTIREFGLLNTDNILCARKVRTGEIVKTVAIRLVGTWKIIIS